MCYKKTEITEKLAQKRNAMLWNTWLFLPASLVFLESQVVLLESGPKLACMLWTKTSFSSLKQDLQFRKRDIKDAEKNDAKANLALGL